MEGGGGGGVEISERMWKEGGGVPGGGVSQVLSYIPRGVE